MWSKLKCQKLDGSQSHAVGSESACALGRPESFCEGLLQDLVAFSFKHLGQNGKRRPFQSLERKIEGKKERKKERKNDGRKEGRKEERNKDHRA